MRSSLARRQGQSAKRWVRSGSPSRAVATVVSLGVILSGCDLSTMAFEQDRRLHFTSPKSEALIKAPVTVSWTMSGFEYAPIHTRPPSKDQGYFAVFVDRAPVKPGATLDSLGDKACRADGTCESVTYLTEKQVYVARGESVTIPQIQQINSYQKVQTHEVTVVLMDTSGHRIGESAWYIDFKMRAAA